MSNYLWLLEPGHGGVREGVYTSATNYDLNNPNTWYKMHVFDNGITIFEGDRNRAIVEAMIGMLQDEGIDYVNIVPELDDVSLGERVRRANKQHQISGRCAYVSIHGNAFGNGANGWEVFTSPSETHSDGIATEVYKQMKLQFPDKKMRVDYSDSDPDKESHFYVLTHTQMPAILTENFFFDNWEEAQILLSNEGITKIAKAHVEAIKKIEQECPF